MTVTVTTEFKIQYPYIPEGKTIEYVPESDPFMQRAKEYARAHSLDKTMPTASVVVKDEVVVMEAANGSDYHTLHGCERVRQNIPTGQGYELCEGCHPKNHSEAKVMGLARAQGLDTQGATLYLWGHWWCCGGCWKAMIDGGIEHYVLMENSEKLFNKEHPDNIVGRQFA